MSRVRGNSHARFLEGKAVVIPLTYSTKPSSIEQREGRGLRQGNENKEVAVYRYVTKGTFDAYSWSLVENKQRFISQVMTSKAVARTCEDIDEATLSYAEIKT